MCGITGILSLKNEHPLLSLASQITDTLSHRGPDGDGFWTHQETGVALGHRRLSIIDLSDTGKQPMMSASGRYVMTYNGEIYTYLPLRAKLEAQGHQFKGHSDTETLLTAIETYGLHETLVQISGMFAIGLWDRQSKTLTLAKDYLGKKPLYVGWCGHDLVFASELKAFKAHPDFKGEIDREAQTLYMRYGCVPAPHCIYTNIWQLKPGHVMSIKLDGLQAGFDLGTLMNAYWSPQSIVDERASSRSKLLDDETAISEFETLLETCVKDRMISDVPLGAFLSGGIDSSAIVALMQKNAPQPVKTYSIGFDVEGYNEAIYAKEVATHLGTEHHELYLKPQDALDVIPALPHIYDEPFADISQIPTFLVSQFAKQHVTVALSGDGGDEMLGGYRRHFMIPPVWNKIKYMPHPLRKILARMILKFGAARWNALGKNRAVPLSDTMEKLAGLLVQKNVACVHDFLLGFWNEADDVVQDTLSHMIIDMPKDLSFTESLMYRDTLSYLPNDILVKVDRASMAVSLESRAPLLDRRIFEHVWTLPEHFKVRNGQGKWLLRQVLAKHVPTSMFDRPKKGFSPPIGLWLRGELKDWAAPYFSESALENAGFNSAPIKKAWDAHQSGDLNLGPKLWTVLMYQTWREA